MLTCEAFTILGRHSLYWSLLGAPPGVLQPLLGLSLCPWHTQVEESEVTCEMLIGVTGGGRVPPLTGELLEAGGKQSWSTSVGTENTVWDLLPRARARAGEQVVTETGFLDRGGPGLFGVLSVPPRR